MEINQKLENVNEELSRYKVEGGWLYVIKTPEGVAMTYSPSIDLKRYESHLRDAYTQGYKDGQSDVKNGVVSEFERLERTDIP